MVAKPLRIGDHFFPTKEKANAHCSEILNRYELGDAIVRSDDHDFLQDLLLRHEHAEEKIGAGIVRFIVDRNPEFRNSRSFFLVRLDGTSTEFAIAKCISTPTHRHEAMRAMRHSVKQVVLNFLKDSFSGTASVTCAATGTSIGRRSDARVVHRAPSLLSMMEEFVAAQGDWVSVTLSRANGQVGPRLSNGEFEAEWVNYYTARHRLAVVSAR